jgi:hypothetical protein
MKLLLFFYLFFLYTISNVSSLFLKQQNFVTNTNQTNLSVIGVFEIIRHGARTPLEKGDTSNFYIGTMRSQLTINGFRQHLLLGRWIRERYIEGKQYRLFNMDFDKLDLSSIEILSSHRQRSIFSSASHLLGMFPNAIIKLNLEGHIEIRNDDVPPIKNFEYDPRDGREVTINVLNGRRDNMFKAAYCRNGGNLTLIQTLRSHQKNIFNITQDNRKKAIDEIFKSYADVIGIDGIDLEKGKYSNKTFKRIISFLRPFKYHYNDTLDLTKTSKQTVAKSVLNKFWSYRLEESKEKKLLSSNIFETLFNFFQSKSKNSTKINYYLLSGFDNTIADVIGNILNPEYLRKLIHQAVDDDDLFTFLVPPVASSLLFELLQDNNNHRNLYVRIIYNGKIISGEFLKPIKLFNKELIELNEFMDLIHSRIEKDYDDLHCNIDN